MFISGESGARSCYADIRICAIFSLSFIVQVLNHSELTSRPSNSVLAMLICLFSKPKTADIFYLNDVHVLIDIIVRQLVDTQPSDERRQDYLLLIENILKNGAYQGHR